MRLQLCGPLYKVQVDQWWGINGKVDTKLLQSNYGSWCHYWWSWWHSPIIGNSPGLIPLHLFYRTIIVLGLLESITRIKTSKNVFF
jgi:hypothetical protein